MPRHPAPTPPEPQPAVSLWRRFFVEPWQRLEQEQRDFLASPAARRFDFKLAGVLVTVAVCLSLQYYFILARDAFETAETSLHGLGLDGAADWLHEALHDSAQWRINELTYWTLGNLFLYLVVPVLLIRLVLREPLTAYGMKLRGAFSDWWIYLVMFGIVAPLLLIVSHDAHFKKTYPFYRVRLGEPLWPNVWRWELLYFCQFIGLEFFFRGFLLHGVKHRFGPYAIFVMTIPYCMIHFGKPLPETFAAILAGLALGFMSLKNRSIWMGASIHMGVALSMDFVSLWRQGYFG
jgi:membrane protease YdiL (CAAX protease family)